MRILVVEDEVELASYLKRGLEREGFVVDVAGDGELGLQMATTNTYNAVVLDIMLPKLNGYRVCAELRAQSNWVPILMLTAKDGEYDEAEALDTGADDYLRKPFSFVVLVAHLRALMRRGAGSRPAVLSLGDLVLDPAKRQFTVDGEPVALTPTEMSIMELFMRHPGDVVSKTEILESCWDWAYEGDVNIVEVYIRYLRKKIDVPYARKHIETVRGAGYRLVEHRG
ncbi:MAG: response regulator transcription factor [Acidimicrobiia bacterium]|nr:response regulator transcription factor [Acidimicrobiia bacterium]MBT8194284.1 response regulator transcription factor [Acidimicrobiia bacterium]NNJ48571.1 response regulator transcription factor [Acidimicrobiia bacterium]NNL13660.1 response regulator transcription factor [Acidimicrobiia bacterium]NNL97901.1 response regulator transcription factor [Acidimicrobiia bacterium]